MHSQRGIGRLRTAAEFAAVRARGRSTQRPFVTMRTLRTNRDQVRFGFVTPKRLGNAVARNRIRRRMRDITRLDMQSSMPGWDIVLTARDGAAGATYAELRSTITDMARQAGFLANESSP